MDLPTTDLPTTIRIIDGGAYLDGGTIQLDAVTESGEPFAIQLNQYSLAGTDHPGRLFYNDTLVNIRSDCEVQLLKLLEFAEIEVGSGSSPNADSSHIGPPVDLVEDELEFKIECIEELRISLIDFVRSEQYVEVAKNGVQ